MRCDERLNPREYDSPTTCARFGVVATKQTRALFVAPRTFSRSDALSLVVLHSPFSKHDHWYPLFPLARPLNKTAQTSSKRYHISCLVLSTNTSDNKLTEAKLLSNERDLYHLRPTRLCKKIAPFVSDLASKFDARAKFYSIDVDVNDELAQKYDVESLPRLLGYHRRQEMICRRCSPNRDDLSDGEALVEWYSWSGSTRSGLCNYWT